MAAAFDTIEERFAFLDEDTSSKSGFTKNAFLKLVGEVVEPKKRRSPVNKNAPIDFLYNGMPNTDLNFPTEFGPGIDTQVHELSAQNYVWGIDIDENHAPYIAAISYQTSIPSDEGQSTVEIIENTKKRMDKDLKENRFRVAEYPEFQRQESTAAGMSVELYSKLKKVWEDEGKTSDEIENELIKYEASFFGAFIGIDPQTITGVTIGEKRVGHDGSSKTISLVYDDQNADITDQILAIVKFKLSVVKDFDIQCAARAVATTFNPRGYKDLKSNFGHTALNEKELKSFKNFSIAYFGQEVYNQHLKSIEP